MATPEVDPSQIPEFLKWMGAIGAGIWSVWKYVDARLEKKADTSDIVEILKRLDKTNDHIEKLYGAAEKDRSFTRDLHDRAMTAVSANQTLIINGQQQIMSTLNSRTK